LLCPYIVLRTNMSFTVEWHFTCCWYYGMTSPVACWHLSGHFYSFMGSDGSAWCQVQVDGLEYWSNKKLHVFTFLPEFQNILAVSTFTESLFKIQWESNCLGVYYPHLTLQSFTKRDCTCFIIVNIQHKVGTKNLRTSVTANVINIL
jgi:hypothetical protein